MDQTITRYCIRDTKGQYLTHTVDLRKGGESLWFTPSPWMAYLFDERKAAESVAAAPEINGIVTEWERPS